MPPLPMGEIGLLITGVARGGTSWAASVCHHLGVNLGRHGPRYENQKLARPLLGGDWDLLRSRIAGEWDPGQAWAWKLPALNQHLDEISALVGGGRFIFVIRDPAAVALRKQKTPQTAGDPVRDARRASEAFNRMLAFAERSRRPSLFLSYEKGLTSPREAAEDIARFIGKSVEGNAIARVVAAVAADQDTYSRVTAAVPPPLTLVARAG